MLNCTIDKSDVGNVLSTGCDFALLWSYHAKEDKIGCSLRSDGRVDVSQSIFLLTVVAKKYGGGGHRAAAGFSIPTSGLGLILNAKRIV